jgi:ribosomal protein L2
MSPAFGGTVVELTDTVATIEVDRWFTGGDAEVVEINYTPGFEALIGTPTLEVGQRYLITATDGVVNGCGYSGVATPTTKRPSSEAFGA